MGEHTPIPWEHRKAVHDAPNHIVAVLFDDHGRRITHFIAECTSAAVDNEANAHFIVEACNNYDRIANLEQINAALLKALEECESFIAALNARQELGTFWRDGRDRCERARDAIALAKQPDIDPVTK